MMTASRKSNHSSITNHTDLTDLSVLSVKEVSQLICSFSDEAIQSKDPLSDERVCQKLASYIFQEQMNGAQLVNAQFDRNHFNLIMHHILHDEPHYDYEWIWTLIHEHKQNFQMSQSSNHRTPWRPSSAMDMNGVPAQPPDDPMMDLDNISPSAIDTLLDEIEENEQHHTQQREQQQQQHQEKQNQIRYGKYLDSQRRQRTPTPPRAPTLDEWIRSHWKIGSFVEVYSVSSAMWATGKITRILMNSNGSNGSDVVNDALHHHDTEQLGIRYEINGQSRTKTLSRDDTFNLRPLSKAMEFYQYIFEALHPNVVAVDHSECSGIEGIFQK